MKARRSMSWHEIMTGIASILSMKNPDKPGISSIRPSLLKRVASEARRVIENEQSISSPLHRSIKSNENPSS